MAKRKDIETTGDDAASAPPIAPAADAAKIDSDADAKAAAEEAEAASKAELLNTLPAVESPSISPAVSEAVAIEETAIEPKAEPEVEAANATPEPTPESASESASSFALVHVPQPSVEVAAEASPETTRSHFSFKARHKRYARLAASVALGAALGAVIGAVLTGSLVSGPRSNVATLEENKAMQQSLTRLAKDVTTLKSKLAAANKLAADDTATRLKQARADITGSISVPQTVPAALTPMPLARPAPRIAAAESLPSARPPVVRNWSIHDTHGGYVYVESQGDIYQIVPGAPLPGLGPVQSIKKLAGRWVVTTPKGIIVSMRDRRFFE